MAISGGALIPLLMGALEDHLAFKGLMAGDPQRMVELNKPQAMSFVVPAVCFVYLLLLSFMGGSKSAPAPATPQS